MSTFRMFALASAAVLLPAQESSRFTGPTSGLIFDAPSRAVRVVMGVPGAAYLGAAVASDLDLGSVSPDSRMAIGIAGGAATLLNLADGSGTALSAAGCEGPVAWSADSSAVALGCLDGVRLYRSRGLSRSGLGGFEGATALAVDGAGGAVFTARKGGIYRVDAEGAKLLAPVEDAVSLTFAGGSLYAVDRVGKQVIALDNVSASASLRIVAGAGQGVEDPLAAGLSVDGTRLFVAEAKALKVFNPATAELLSTVELDFAPGVVDALGNSLFLLKARKEASDTVQVLDARQLAVFFIPAQDLGSVANLED